MRDKGEINFWKILNTCSVGLALVSFFTTSQGFSDFFFTESSDKIFGYITSGAIQGILLLLNLRLPKYLLKKEEERKLEQGIRLGSVIVLYFFTILWSSGFSYVFVSNAVYKETWYTDAQREMGNFYQQEGYELKLQLQKATSSLTAEMMEGMGQLRQIAQERDTDAENGENNISLDFDKYRQLFEQDPEILEVIHSLEGGKEKASSSAANAEQVLKNREQEIANQISILNGEVNQCQQDLNNEKNNRTNLINQRATVPTASAAHESYTDAIEEAQEDIDAKQEALTDKQEELENANDKQLAIQAMISYNNTFIKATQTQVDTAFQEIITQLGGTDPDDKVIKQKLSEVYTQLSQEEEWDTEARVELLTTYTELQEDVVTLEAVRKSADTLGEDTMEVLVETEKILNNTKDFDKESWEQQWKDSFMALKEGILSIPDENIGQNDKEELIDEINQYQRNYLEPINNLEKCVIYFKRANTTSAVVSVLFATFLDSAPMLLAFFKYYQRKKDSN